MMLIQRMCKYYENLIFSGFVGGISVLVCSITGPAIISIPTVFQSGGWLVTIIAFVFIAVLANLASLFLLEALTKFPGNENFEVRFFNNHF
jgi:amino acid permease